MKHDISLSGQRFGLRPVGVEDAAFIVSLRSDPALNRFIHATSGDVGEQVAWIERYFERPGDWYFIIVDGRTGQKVGTVGIYDHDPRTNTAEWGRWIVRPPSVAAIESALLVYRIAFEVLGLAAVVCRTVVDNKPVVSFHDTSGARRGATLADHVELAGRRHDSIEHVTDPSTWPSMKARMDAFAARLAR